MIIKRKTALFFAVINFLFCAYNAGRFFLLHQIILEDFSHLPVRMTNGDVVLFMVIPGLVAIILYVGLFWVMRTFKEQKWMQSGLIVFFLCRLLSIIAPWIILALNWSARYFIVGSYLMNFSLLYMVFTFVFVRTSSIRKYYWAFAGLMFFCLVRIYAAPALYGMFRYRWLFINQELLFSLPFLASLMLFVDVYYLSFRTTSDNEAMRVRDNY
ncbi:hypothetical protein HQ865_24440 [Mucilaginibacter mali]|uniref:Uncharacterized protein n=1 Tax=Mucilaginibacter mali TaxID=2740462 RepID=A0A7D4QBK6_9SPHI|nr:hypothetical protein [Mucilaginibacter mali]QKJ32771.1 hypothetical protein HQ865_24440 [Mucilaginibacter mali]